MEASKIGLTNKSFKPISLKNLIIKNDAGDWGNAPNGENVIGVLRSTNFNNNGIYNIEDLAYRSLSKNKIYEKTIEEGDILIERSGGSDIQPVGRLIYVDDELTKEPLVFSNFVQRISLNKSICSPKYIYYVLQQMYEMGITESMQFQTTGIRNLDYKYYLTSKIPQPPKPEQQAIAGIFSKVDEAIIATKESIKATENLKKALMQNLLTGKLKPDGTWRKEDEFYIDEKFGRVPLGWKVKTLGEFGSFNNGVNFSKSQLGSGHPFVNLKDIYDNKIININNLERVKVDNIKNYVLNKGDIVFVRSSVKPSGIGWASLFNGSEEPVIFCGFVIKYSFDTEVILPEYLLELLHFTPIRNRIIALGQVVANTNINQKSLKGLRIAFPTDDIEQKEIYEYLKNTNESIEKKINKIKSLERLKKSLMQQLLTGKKRVNVKEVEKLLNQTKM